MMKSLMRTASLGCVIFLWGCATAPSHDPMSGDAAPLITGHKVDPSAKKHNAAGIEQYEKGYWLEARSHFEAAVQAAPSLPEPHYNLALALDKLGARRLARDHFQIAGQLGRNNMAILESSIYKSYMGE